MISGVLRNDSGAARKGVVPHAERKEIEAFRYRISLRGRWRKATGFSLK